jgi:hypothetical protein
MVLVGFQINSMNARFNEGTDIPENEGDNERRKREEKRTTHQ